MYCINLIFTKVNFVNLKKIAESMKFTALEKGALRYLYIVHVHVCDYESIVKVDVSDMHVMMNHVKIINAHSNLLNDDLHVSKSERIQIL